MSKTKKRESNAIDEEVRGCFAYDASEELCEAKNCIWTGKDCKQRLPSTNAPTIAPTRRPTIGKKIRKLVIDEELRGCFNYDKAEICEQYGCEWTGKDCVAFPSTLAPTGKPTTRVTTASPTLAKITTASPTITESPVVKQCSSANGLTECNNIQLPYTNWQCSWNSTLQKCEMTTQGFNTNPNNNNTIAIVMPVVISILFVITLLLGVKAYRAFKKEKEPGKKEEPRSEPPTKTTIVSKEEPSSVMKTPRRSFASPRAKVIPGNSKSLTLHSSLLKLKNELNKDSIQELDLV